MAPIQEILSKLPPRWKVKRELERIRLQSARGFRNLYEPVIQTYHDRFFDRRVKVHQGQDQVRDRLAILLIWQRGALPASLGLTLRTLKRAGFGTVVVSNCPLVPDALYSLMQSCVAVLERPNFGYDFGGYRDAIRFIFGSYSDLETLLVLNDSTWFPLREDDQTLETLLRDPGPYKGMVNKQVVYRKNERKHLESHFLMFERPVLRHPDFQNFWKNYRVSSDRYNTIQRGEYGISVAVTGAGFPMSGVIDPMKFDAMLERLSPAELRDVLRHAVHVKQIREDELAQVLSGYSDDTAWRNLAVQRMSKQVWTEEHLLTTAFIYPGLLHMGFPYLKKRRDHMLKVTRIKALEMVDTGIIPAFHPDVEAEVRRSV